MKKNIKLCNVVVVIVILTLVFTGCGGKKSDTASKDDLQAVKITDKISDKEFNNLKTTINKVINDDIWFHGPYSKYQGFEMQRSNIEIYTNSKHGSNYYYILFLNSICNKLSNNKEFYCVGINKDEKMGFVNYIGLSFERKTLKEAREELLSAGGDTLIKKGSIQFKKADKPKYILHKRNKNELISKIVAMLQNELLNRYNMTPGLYEAYVRDFGNNDIFTYVVLENESKSSLLLTIDLPENGDVNIDKIEDINMYDELKYTAEQYKKISVIKKIKIGNNSEESSV